MKLLSRYLSPVAVLALLAGLTAALTAPPDRIQGDLMRLMYVHVPAAWLAYLSFALTFGASVGWLWKRHARLDRLAAAGAEVGVFFTGLTIALGSVWGKPVWGVWWTWDPRLVTTALMFFVYLGYLALRRAGGGGGGRARRAAVFGVLAFAQVPIVHMSVIWWRALHQPPTVLRPGDPTIDHWMLAVLLVNLVAFTLVFAVLLRARLRLAAAEEALEAAGDDATAELAGSAVTAPRLGTEATHHV